MSNLDDLVEDLIRARQDIADGERRRAEVTEEIHAVIGRGNSARVVTSDGEVLTVRAVASSRREVVDPSAVAKLCPTWLLDVVCPRRVDLKRLDAAIDARHIKANDLDAAVIRGPAVLSVQLRAPK